MKFPENCRQVKVDPKIVLDDHKSKCRMAFINTKRQDVLVVRVDDCVIKEGIRCDYLVVSVQSVEHFVELKGGDVEHAVAQIERTIELVSSNKQNQEKICFIVSTRSPALTAKVQNLKVYFKKKYNSLLIFKTHYCEHHL